MRPRYHLTSRRRTRSLRTSDLQQQQCAAWSQDAPEFLKRACQIGDVAQSVAHGDEIDTGVRYRQLFGIPPDHRNPQRAPGLRKHSLADVQADHVNVVLRDAQRRPGDQPSADGDIEKPHASMQAIPLKCATAVPIPRIPTRRSRLMRSY